MKSPNSKRLSTADALIFTDVENLPYLNSPYLTRFLNLRHFLSPLIIFRLGNIPKAALCFTSISLAHNSEFRQPAGEEGASGLSVTVTRALFFAFFASLPMLLAFALTSKLNPNIAYLTVGAGCFIASFAEEIHFRVCLLRHLYRRARSGFWLSALIPSILFAAGHFYQSNNFWELAGISAITGLGSLLSCWMFLRWQDSLWAIFGLHSLLNLRWEGFAIDDIHAPGEWIAVAARFLTIASVVIFAIYKDRIRKLLPPAETANISTSSDRENPGETDYGFRCRPDSF